MEPGDEVAAFFVGRGGHRAGVYDVDIGNGNAPAAIFLAVGVPATHTLPPRGCKLPRKGRSLGEIDLATECIKSNFHAAKIYFIIFVEWNFSRR